MTDSIVAQRATLASLAAALDEADGYITESGSDNRAADDARCIIGSVSDALRAMAVTPPDVVTVPDVIVPAPAPCLPPLDQMCDKCQGAGEVVIRRRCMLCDQEWADDVWDDGWYGKLATLPCGHSWDHLQDARRCGVCREAGRVPTAAGYAVLAFLALYYGPRSRQ